MHGRLNESQEDIIPMVCSNQDENDNYDENTVEQFNAIDANEENSDYNNSEGQDQYGEDDGAGLDVEEIMGASPEHWMRFLKTQSTKQMEGVKF